MVEVEGHGGVVEDQLSSLGKYRFVLYVVCPQQKKSMNSVCPKTAVRTKYMRVLKGMRREHGARVVQFLRWSIKRGFLFFLS